jgi:chromate transporter
VLFVLPSLCILIALSWVYLRFGDVPAVAGLFYGIKPAVTALVLHAAHRIGSRALKNRWMWGIAAAPSSRSSPSTRPSRRSCWPPARSATWGRVGARGVLARRRPRPRPGAPRPGLIDDDTPTPPHARFSRARLARVLGVGAGLWLLAMGVLVAAQGVAGTLTQMGWFFSKAALLTFGGAYAVLPYVYQGAVEHHHWLSGAQMIDGLALGETTPGR